MINESATSHGHSRCRGPQDGFTVVELIFVTAILSIIAAIAIPAYISFIQKARETSVVAYLGKARKAQEMYSLEHTAGLFSASFDELETTGMVEPAVGAASRTEGEYLMTLSAGVVDGEPVWSISASPLSANPDAKHFYIDQAGVVRYAVGAVAGPGSPPFQR